MKSKIKNRISLGAFWVVMAWSVFLFGAVTGGPRVIAGFLAATAGAIALFALPRRRALPPVPILLGIAMATLFFFGWYMTINAKADHSMTDWLFVPVEGRPLDFDWAPGSIVLTSSLRMVIEMSLTLVALLGVVRATESGAWRVVVKTIAIFGALVALTGFFHKAMGAKTVWWIDDPLSRANHFFAPFVYHANAGAFLNLCLPLAIGLGLTDWTSKTGRAKSTFWGLVSVLIFSATLATASKGAMAISFLLLSAMLFWNGRRVWRLLSSFCVDRRRRVERMTFVGIVWLMGIVFAALGVESSLKRWEEFISRFSDPDRTSIDAREGIMRLMIRMAGPEEGSWHGFGPGSFPHLVPYFTATDEEIGVIPGRWLHGHSDPLQTLVEWGYLGAAAWLVIGAGGVICGMLVLRKRNISNADLPLVRGMVVALVMVGAHSCFDFPLSIYALHLVAILMCGICWGLYGMDRRASRKRKQKKKEVAAEESVEGEPEASVA